LDDRVATKAMRTQSATGEPAVAAPPSIEEELRLLRRVERALREGDPRAAFISLRELDRRVPEGQLTEERAAADVMVRCALALGTPAALVRRFSDAYPESAYLARVRQSCARDGRHQETEP
jgi:hypothetical protein